MDKLRFGLLAFVGGVVGGMIADLLRHAF